MNKTKKYKYLRKNRDNEYRKHKTRKIQYGGNKNPFKKLETSGSTSNKEEEIQATRKSALAVAEKLETEAKNHTNPVIKNELLAKAARLKSIAEEEPDPDVVLIPKGAKNGLLGWFSSFFKKSQQNLPIEMSQVALTDEMPQIIEDTKDNAELVREINRMYKNRIKKILSDIYQRSITENTNIGITPEESLEIDNLLEKIYGNSERLNEGLIYPSQLSHAQISGNIMSTESVGQQPMFGQQPQSQSPQSKHGDPDKSSKQQPSPGQPTPPGAAAAGVAGAAQPSPAAAQPSLTDKIKNKLKNAATATRKIFSKKSPEEVKAAAQAKAEREAEAQANRAEQIKIEEAAGLKRGKGIVGRASDSVKNTLSSVKNTLSSVKNPFNKTQKKTDPENTSESKPLLGDSSRSNDSNDSATQKKSWRESASARVKTAKNALISTKDALLNRITRKNRGTQNPEGSAIEMQEIKEDDSSQPTSSQTPPTRAPPPRPTSVPPSSPAVSPPPPPRPTSFPPPAPTSVPPAEKFTQAGGNITRKNRQYIHEIKDNRTHLFNKEMEIINSIRNFKHGLGRNEHGKNKPENIQKKFIKVIKRS